MKGISLNMFNNILKSDISKVKDEIFEIIESNKNMVPLSLSKDTLVFVDLNEDKPRFFASEYKYVDEKVECTNVSQIEINFGEPKNKLRVTARKIIESIYDNKLEESNLKKEILDSVKYYINKDSEFNGLGIKEKITESISRKVLNNESNKFRKITKVKINKFFNKIEENKLKEIKDRIGIKNVVANDGEDIVFYKQEIKKGKRNYFTEKFVWNVKKLKKLTDSLDYALLFKNAYELYIRENKDYKKYVNEIASIDNIEILVKKELNSLFKKAAKKAEFPIDDEEKNNLVDETYETILLTNKDKINEVIGRVMRKVDIDEDLDMESVMKGVRRAIYLSENNEDMVGSEIANLATPQESDTEIDAEIEVATDIEDNEESPLEYNIEDIAILIDALKAILLDISPVDYESLYGEEESDDLEVVDEQIKANIEAKKKVLENVKNILSYVNEDSNRFDIVAVNTDDIEQQVVDNVVSDTILDDNIDELDQNNIYLIKKYLGELEIMKEEEIIDSEELENIIDFVAQYYDKINDMEDEQKEDEKPKVEEPKVEEPKSEEPKVEEPETE
jgi:hypothetical protein